MAIISVPHLCPAYSHLTTIIISFFAKQNATQAFNKVLALEWIFSKPASHVKLFCPILIFHTHLSPYLLYQYLLIPVDESKRVCMGFPYMCMECVQVFLPNNLIPSFVHLMHAFRHSTSSLYCLPAKTQLVM